MRLTQLCESMIRLPPTMTKDFMEFVYAYIIDFMYVTTDDHRVGHDLLSHINIKPKKPEFHRKLVFKHADNVIMKARVSLKSYRFKYDIDEADKALVIRLVDMGPSIHGGYDDDKTMLTINMHSLKMLLANNPVNEKFVAYVLKDIENTIEHELMHYVQHKSFGKKDPQQLNRYDSKDNSHDEYIKYATSPVEFLPTLRSEFKTFEAKLHFLEKDVFVNDNDKMQLLRYYIGDKTARVQRFVEFLDDFRSSLLWSLRDKDQKQWQKAVKIMLEQFKEYQTSQALN